MKEIAIGPGCPLNPNMINIYMVSPPRINHIISINSDDTIMWKVNFFLYRNTFTSYIISPSAKRTLYINMEEFLSDLKKIYPEDYEFFLWHPSAANGIWNE